MWINPSAQRFVKGSGAFVNATADFTHTQLTFDTGAPCRPMLALFTLILTLSSSFRRSGTPWSPHERLEHPVISHRRTNRERTTSLPLRFLHDLQLPRHPKPQLHFLPSRYYHEQWERILRSDGQ